MTTHWKVRIGSVAFALAAALFVTTPSYGFWFLFGYPHHTNDTGHYGSCGDADHGYIYHHQNTHNEPFFKEQTSSEHYAAHHGPRAHYVVRQEAYPSRGEYAKVHKAKCCDTRRTDRGHRRCN